MALEVVTEACTEQIAADFQNASSVPTGKFP